MADQSRPLLISDCDDVLLHMMGPFGTWLDERHAIEFAPTGPEFVNVMRRRGSDAFLARDEMWPLLDDFFDNGMDRQTLVPHAADALARIGEIADIVILTNLQDHRREHRIAQLEKLGIRHRVICNQGGKGTPVAKLVEEYRPSSTVFVDDIASHHESVSRHVPQVWRLHMIADPVIAGLVPASPHAHERIDDWAVAVDWVLVRLREPA